jgi:predicted GIY-YIG superfamily endonuclease
MHFIYVLKVDKDKLYIGYTKDLERRVEEHQNTKNCKLLYFEAYSSSNLAREREKKLKHYGSAWHALRRAGCSIL